jgi:hypothetical protein
VDIHNGDGLGHSCAFERLEPSDGGQLLSEWAGFLQGFHWQAFATLTFRDEVGREFAGAAFGAWLSRQHPNAYAAAGFELGPAGGRVHIHALIGGLYRGSPAQLLLPATARVRSTTVGWTMGQSRVFAYDPRQRATWYVAKGLDVELFGRLRRHRPRRRRYRLTAR